MFFSKPVLLALAVFAPHVIAARGIQVSTPAAFKEASPIVTTSNTLTLTKITSAKGYNPRSAAYLLGLTASSKIATSNHSTTLLSLEEGEEFATSITFGDETFESLVDTGSSDTWIVETGFKCVDITTSTPEPESYCAFGPTYNVTDTFKQTPDENFNITYGDGEFLTGIIGTESVTLAGITVNQTVALVNYAAWEGDGTTSGLIGLAYPAMYIPSTSPSPNRKTDETQHERLRRHGSQQRQHGRRRANRLQSHLHNHVQRRTRRTPLQPRHSPRRLRPLRLHVSRRRSTDRFRAKLHQHPNPHHHYHGLPENLRLLHHPHRQRGTQRRRRPALRRQHSIHRRFRHDAELFPHRCRRRRERGVRASCSIFGE